MATKERKPSRAKELERDVTKQVKKYLELRGWRGVRFQRTVANSQFSSGEPGQADFIFLHYAHRLMLWIEFKSPTGHLGPKQVEWIERERLRGAIVEVVNDADAFKDWYEANYGISGQMRLG